MTSLLKQIFHLHPWVFPPQKLHILQKKVRNEQREQHFSRGKTIEATIKVVPWRESQVIPTKFHRRQKIVMLFLAAQIMLELPKNLVLRVRFQ